MANKKLSVKEKEKVDSKKKDILFSAELAMESHNFKQAVVDYEKAIHMTELLEEEGIKSVLSRRLSILRGMANKKYPSVKKSSLKRLSKEQQLLKAEKTVLVIEAEAANDNKDYELSEKLREKAVRISETINEDLVKYYLKPTIKVHKDHKVEFKVNEKISLKLKNKKTFIYVNGEEFIQCKFLLLRGVQKTKSKRADDSIDSMSEELSSRLEEKINPSILGITPEVEFWGHCSNLQAWVENEYATELLHRDIAFPLLKKLTDSGDTLAEKAFKDEIARRFASKNPNVRKFLLKEGYLKYLKGTEYDKSLDD